MGRYSYFLLAVALIGCSTAGDAAAPVRFVWSIHSSHSPSGHRLRLQGGTQDAIPTQVRLLDRDGQVVSIWVTVPLSPADTGLCRGERQGTVQSDLPIPAAHLPAFRPKSVWPADYRVEALVGNTWRPAQLTFAGCISVE